MLLPMPILLLLMPFILLLIPILLTRMPILQLVLPILLLLIPILLFLIAIDAASDADSADCNADSATCAADSAASCVDPHSAFNPSIFRLHSALKMMLPAFYYLCCFTMAMMLPFLVLKPARIVDFAASLPRLVFHIAYTAVFSLVMPLHIVDSGPVCCQMQCACSKHL